MSQECLKLGKRGNQNLDEELIKLVLTLFNLSIYILYSKLYYCVNVSQCPTTRMMFHAGISAVLADEIF